MQKLISDIVTLIPFLSSYPFWVKCLISAWVLLTAIIAVCLLFTHKKSEDHPGLLTEINAKKLELDHRPYLSISVMKQEDTKNYYSVITDENSVYFVLSILLENIGESPAVNITIPKYFHLKDAVTTDELLQFDFPENFLLDPKKKYAIDFKMGGDVANGKVEEQANVYRKNKSSIQFKFIIDYENFYDKSQKYRSEINFELTPDQVVLLGDPKVT